MINLKEHDLVLNLLGNQHFSAADFKAVGLTADNTSLLPESTYLSSKKILDNPYFHDLEGKFDDKKFHSFYQAATSMYNMMADDTYLDKMAAESVMYDKDDIFAPVEQRRKFEDTVVYTRQNNPDRRTLGLVRVNEFSLPKNSRDEIAQTLKVLANPTTAGDNLENAIWHDSPNDSWFTDFWDTRVLAQWDSDGTHTDLVTGETVNHKKGELKLNENGTYYYENLDGRNIYGRHVLNKMNTLTTDGSAWNKYDFFDSDGLDQKSIGGTVMKNLALVGSMFIPYVGPWIAGVSAASQIVGLAGTLGKMLSSSESPTFSAMEGWAKSVNRQTAKSQYALEHTWCWENFISLIGDVAGQLKELRFLFEYAPAIIKGTSTVGWNGISKVKTDRWIKELAEENGKKYGTAFSEMVAKREAAGKAMDNATELIHLQSRMKSIGIDASNFVLNFLKSYNKIGEILSKGYMTAITVGDTYGEAKLQGASDIEATLLTLGYGAAEMALLNTDLGNWILPELKAEGIRNKALMRAFALVPKEHRITSASMNSFKPEAKKDLIKYWFNKGKMLRLEMSENGKDLLGMTISGALGEGFEETSEELLADFSKSCFNVVNWLRGDDTRMTAWDNVWDRYSMSLVGGAVGGGLTAAGTNFKVNNEAFTPQLAMQEIVYLAREGKLGNLYKALDKMTVSNPYVQNEWVSDEKGNWSLKPVEEGTSSMDSDIKQFLRNQLQSIEDIVKAEGLKVTDSRFLNLMAFNDIRLAALAQTASAGAWVQNYNSLGVRITEIVLEMNKLTNDLGVIPEKLAEYNKLNEELMLKRLELKKHQNGEYNMAYISSALMELTSGFSPLITLANFKDYVEEREHLDFDKIAESRIEKLRADYEGWKQSDYKDKALVNGALFLQWNKNGNWLLEGLKQYAEQRKNTTIKDFIANLQLLSLGLSQASSIGVLTTGEDLDYIIENIAKELKWKWFNGANYLINNKGSESSKARVKEAITRRDSLLKEDSGATEEELKLATNYMANIIGYELASNFDTYFGDFIKFGALNPEIKHELLDVSGKALGFTSTALDNLSRFGAKAVVSESKNALNTPVLEVLDAEGFDNIALDVLDGDADLLLKEVNNLATIMGLPTKPDLSYTYGDIIKILEKVLELHNLVMLLYNKLNEAGYSAAILYLQNHFLQNSDSKLDIVKFLDNVDILLNQNKEDLTLINMESMRDQFIEVDNAIKWLLAMILAARYDTDGNISNLVGYNATLNEIAHKNHVKDWTDLPLANKTEADIALLDLQLIRNKLLLAKNLTDINAGKKLTVTDRVSTNYDFVSYNRVGRLLLHLDDDDTLWQDKDSLREALEKAETLKLFAPSRDLKLTLDLRNKIKRERLEIDKAVYKFFNSEKNQELIKKGLLYKLFSKDFDLWHGTSLLVNTGMEVMDDRNFIWWLASRAAVDRSKFLYEYNSVIDPSTGLAPLPSLEEATYYKVAAVLNGGVISQFADAVIQAATELFNQADENGKRDILRKIGISENGIEATIKSADVLNWDVMPMFKNFLLTEGIPGAGKSLAVDALTSQILQTFHADTVAKNVWYAHRTKESADDARDGLAFKNIKTFGHNELIKEISKEFDLKIGDGTNEYSWDEFTVNPDNKKISIKAKPNSGVNWPSLMIIDEISHYDLAELLLLQSLAEQLGITILASGDFDQSTILAVVKRPDGTVLTLTPANSMFPHSPKLGLSMRSGNIQMEKTSSAMLAWLLLPLDVRKTLTIKLYSYEDENGFYGVKLANGYTKPMAYIDKMVKDFLNTKQQKLEKATSEAEKRKIEREKIGFIYYDETSEVYKDTVKKYGDLFEYKKGSAAQGLEGIYYVVDFSGDIKSDMAKDLYTGITRAKKGALIVTNNLSLKIEEVPEKGTAETTPPFVGLQNYAKNIKKLYDSWGLEDKPILYIPRSKSLETIESKPDEEKAVEENVELSPVSTTATVEAPPVLEGKTWKEDVRSVVVDDKVYLTDGETVAVLKDINTVEEVPQTDQVHEEAVKIYHDIKEGDNELILGDERVDNSTLNQELKLLNKLTPPEVISEDEEGELKEFSYSLYSMNSQERGVDIDEDGKMHYFSDVALGQEGYREALKAWNEPRIDNIPGLAKIWYGDNWYEAVEGHTNVLEYDLVLAELANYFMTAEDYVDGSGNTNYAWERLINHTIPSILNKHGVKVKVTGLEFGINSAANVGNGRVYGGNTANEYAVFDRHKDEKSIGNSDFTKDSEIIEGNDDRRDSINRKTIGATITVLTENKRKHALYIPLFVLGNLATLTTNPKGKIAKKLAKIMLEVGGNAFLFHRAITEDPELKKIPELFNLAKLFLFTTNGHISINSVDGYKRWLPGTHLRNLGTWINVEARGYNTFDGKGSEIPVSKYLANNPRLYPSSQIYTALAPISIKGSTEVVWPAPKGHAYMLVTQNPDLKGRDDAMLNRYFQELADPTLLKLVTRILLVSPKFTIKDYLTNLNKILNNKPAKPLGSYLTPYYIWKAILPRLKNKDKIFKDWKEDQIKFIEDSIAKIDAAKEAYDNETDPNKKAVLHQKILLAIKEKVTLAEELYVLGSSVGERSLYEHLRYYMIYAIRNGYGNDSEHSINSFAKMVKEAGLEYVYYLPKFKSATNEGARPAAVLESDQTGDGKSLFSVEGFEFGISGKIDSALFTANRKQFTELLTAMASKVWKDKDGRYKSFDIGKYLGFIRLEKGKELIIEETPEVTVSTKEYDITDPNTGENSKLVFTNINGAVTLTKDGKPIQPIEPYDWNTIEPFEQLAEEVAKSYLSIQGVESDSEVVKKILQAHYNDYIYNGSEVAELLENYVKNYISNINNTPDNRIAYRKDGIVKVLTISDENLKKLGLDSISINDESLLNILESREKILTINLGKGSTLDINLANGTMLAHSNKPDLIQKEETKENVITFDLNGTSISIIPETVNFESQLYLALISYISNIDNGGSASNAFIEVINKAINRKKFLTKLSGLTAVNKAYKDLMNLDIMKLDPVLQLLKPYFIKKEDNSQSCNRTISL